MSESAPVCVSERARALLYVYVYLHACPKWHAYNQCVDDCTCCPQDPQDHLVVIVLLPGFGSMENIIQSQTIEVQLSHFTNPIITITTADHKVGDDSQSTNSNPLFVRTHPPLRKKKHACVSSQSEPQNSCTSPADISIKRYPKQKAL